MRLILRAGRERAGSGLVVARFCNQTKTELIVLELMDGQIDEWKFLFKLPWDNLADVLELMLEIR